MAAALPFLEEILTAAAEWLPRIFRVLTFFKQVSKVRKLEGVLKYEHLIEIVKKDKKVKDWVLNQLFKLQLKSNQFIFFSDEDLINYVRSKDPEARILKLLETKEINLYIVEGKVFSNKWQGLLNYFTFALLFAEFNKFNISVINAITNTYNELNTELLNMKNRILDKLAQEKQNDINNTYCQRCSCCCSCSADKGSCSCCCECECNLIHYIQAWDNLQSFIEQQFTEYRKYMYNVMINKEEKNSLVMQFTLLFDLLMKFFFIRVKERYLFAVIKEKYILKEFEKDKKKTGVMKILYNYLKSLKGRKFEYDKLIENIQKYLYYKLKKNYTREQVQVLYATVCRRYDIKVIKYKDNNKLYVVIV